MSNLVVGSACAEAFHPLRVPESDTSSATERWITQRPSNENSLTQRKPLVNRNLATPTQAAYAAPDKTRIPHLKPLVNR